MLNQVNQVRIILVGILAALLVLLLAISPFVRPTTADDDIEVEQVESELEDGEAVETEPVEGESDVIAVSTRSIADVPILTDDSIEAELNPIMQIGQRPEQNVVTYTVARGDTPNTIADKFGIKPETILGGNPNLSEESSLLQAGVPLKILPIDGVLHEVSYGESLESIAATYSVSAEEIIAYAPNNLEFPFRVYKGSEILVPGAVRELFVWTPPKLSNRSASTLVGTGTFVQPVRTGCVTQYFYPWHRGLDIGLANGTPVYAMDTGTVIYASWAAGSYYDYGNLIVIDHGNGYETYYAHLSGINVFPAQEVRQGQRIGSTGNTGRSSGPHLHAEIRFNNVQDDPSWLIQGTYSGCEIGS
ncbi:MAG: peptidoglycan DD-metalloendopeptidase family protein [Anaerolineae bacterium]